MLKFAIRQGPFSWCRSWECHYALNIYVCGRYVSKYQIYIQIITVHVLLLKMAFDMQQVSMKYWCMQISWCHSLNMYQYVMVNCKGPRRCILRLWISSSVWCVDVTKVPKHIVTGFQVPKHWFWKSPVELCLHEAEKITILQLSCSAGPELHQYRITHLYHMHIPHVAP